MKKRLFVISSIVMATGCVHCMQKEKTPIGSDVPAEVILQSAMSALIELGGIKSAPELSLDARAIAQSNLDALLFGPQFRRSICKPMVVDAIEHCSNRLLSIDGVFSSISDDLVGSDEMQYEEEVIYTSPKSKVIGIVSELTRYPVNCIAEILGMDDAVNTSNVVGKMIASINNSDTKKEQLEYVVSLAILCSYFFDKHKDTNYKGAIRQYLTNERATFSPDECLVFFTSLLLNFREIPREKEKESAKEQADVNAALDFLHRLFTDNDVRNIREAMKIEFHASFFPEIAGLFRSNRDLHSLERKFFIDCCFGNYIDIVALNDIVNDIGNICPSDLNCFFKNSFQDKRLCFSTTTTADQYVLPKILPSPSLPNGRTRKIVLAFNAFINMVCSYIDRTVVVPNESGIDPLIQSMSLKELHKSSIREINADNSSIIKKNPNLYNLPVVSAIFQKQDEVNAFQQRFVLLDGDCKKMKTDFPLVALALYVDHFNELVGRCASENGYSYLAELSQMAQQNRFSFSIDLNKARNYCLCTKNAPIVCDDSDDENSSSSSSDDENDSFFTFDPSSNCLNYQDMRPLKDAALTIAKNNGKDPYYDMIARGNLCYLRTFFERLLMRALMLCSLNIKNITDGNKELLEKNNICGMPLGNDVFGLDEFSVDIPRDTCYTDILPRIYRPKIVRLSEVLADLKDGIRIPVLDNHRLMMFIKSTINNMSEKSQKKKEELEELKKKEQPAKTSSVNMEELLFSGHIVVPDDYGIEASVFFGLRPQPPSRKDSIKNLLVEDMGDIDCGHMQHIFSCNSDFSDIDVLNPNDFGEQVLRVLNWIRSDLESGPGMFFNVDLFRYTLCKFYGLVSAIDRDVSLGKPVCILDMDSLTQVTGFLLQSLHRCSNARIEGIINSINFLIDANDFKELSAKETFSLLSALVVNEIFVETFRFGVVHLGNPYRPEEKATYEPYIESARWVALAMQNLNGKYGMNIEEKGGYNAPKLEKRDAPIEAPTERIRRRNRIIAGERPVKMLNEYLKKFKEEFYKKLPTSLKNKMSNDANNDDQSFFEIVNELMDEAMKHFYFKKITEDIYGALLSDMFQKYTLESATQMATPDTTSQTQKINFLCDIMYRYGMLKDTATDMSGLSLESMIESLKLQKNSPMTITRHMNTQKREIRGPSSSVPLSDDILPMANKAFEAMKQRQIEATIRRLNEQLFKTIEKMQKESFKKKK
ncbi:hypothetical protein FACS1894122_06250 [Alphaproteobacteria bacterium]|nr:hypothetical protein FACS1894122_06250 [Alphaproteobacteria bacterium]